MGDASAVGTLLQMVENMAHLSHKDRMTVLCVLLAEEICTLPPGARRAALDEVLDEMPGLLRAAETVMRQTLVANARRGA